MGCIYYIFHKESGKGYIGKTRYPTPDVRIRKHSTYKSLLGYALRKYGVDTFKTVVLYSSENEVDLFNHEVYFIDLLDTQIPNGYNVDSGGKGSYHDSQKDSHLSEDRKEVISASMKGIVLSEEHKKAISEGGKGRVLSEEHKKKIGNSQVRWYDKYLPQVR